MLGTVTSTPRWKESAPSAPSEGPGTAPWPFMIWTLGALPAVAGLTTPRFFSSATTFAAGPFELLGDHLRLLGLALSAVALVLALGAGHRRVSSSALWLGAMALSLGPILSMFFSRVPSLSLEYLGFLLVVSAVVIAPPIPLARFRQSVARALTVYVWGSVASVVVAPGWALERPYSVGMLPWPSLRLHGLCAHANVLGAMLATFLIVSGSRDQPMSGRATRAAAWILLLLTQSKTSWISIAVFLLVRALVTRRTSPDTLFGKRVLLATCAVPLLAMILYVRYDPSTFDPQSRSKLETLTGRTGVWTETLRLWDRDRVFGYGLSLWDADMRARAVRVIGWAPPHAHSQVLHSLGESGYVGVAGLIVYLAVLVSVTLRLMKEGDHLALILVCALLLRGITEVPLRTFVNDGMFFSHFVVVAYLVVRLGGIESGTEAEPALAALEPGLPVQDGGARRAQLRMATCPPSQRGQDVLE